MASGGHNPSDEQENLSLRSLPTTPTKQAVPKTPNRTPVGSPFNSTGSSPASSPCNSATCIGFSGGSRTPNSDRFIPSRMRGERLELSQYLLNVPKSNGNEVPEWMETEEQRDMKQKQKALSVTLAGDIKKAKVLNFCGSPSKEGSDRRPLNNLVALKPKPPKRILSSMPEKILDAPNVLDDYYFNLLDWSCDGVVGVALGGSAYLWTNDPPDTHLLMQTFGNNSCITSLAFDRAGHRIAVGTSHSQLQLYDVATRQHVRTIISHSDGRVAALSWNQNGILVSGGQDGFICIYDVRQAQPVKRFLAHSQEVCGLAWSPNGRMLASGGADHKAHVWSYSATRSIQRHEPILTISRHRATVKALAWCPWRPQILATAGGYEDGCIHFWNTNNNMCETSIKVHAQVCSLMWAPNHQELVAGLGTPNNCASVWKYKHPSVKKIKDLPHSGRVLSLALSPENNILATICGDECLRFWRSFACDTKGTSKEKIPSPMFRQNVIR